MRADLREYRGGAQIGRCRLGKYRPVHDLSGALAGYSEVHEIPSARIPENVSERRLPAQHAADDRPPGAGNPAGRGAGRGGAVEFGSLGLHHFEFVMAGLVPAIHVFLTILKTWMPATSAGMTSRQRILLH